MAPFHLRPWTPLFLALWAAVSIAGAQSIAASLSGYQATLRVANVAGVPARSFSGAAFHPATHTLYVIDDDNSVIYELSAAGILLRSITTSGFQDTEGIAYQADDFFYITEEGLASIVRIRLPRSGGGPVARSDGTSLNLGPNMANSGIEGVSYRPANKTAYAVKEIDPPRLYRIALDAAGNPTAAFPDDPFNIGGKSGDAADIYALDDGNFILVNQEQGKLEGYGPQGQVLSSLALGMSKPEGLAIDTGSGTIYVVGEPNEFAVFKKTGARARDPVPGEGGFSCAWVSGGTAGAAPALRYSLPYRTSVRIESAAPDGAWTEAFHAEMAEGLHLYVPERPAPVGIRFYRFSAGPFHRVLKAVSFRD